MERAPAVSKGLSHERPLGLSSSMVFLISVAIQAIGFLGNYFVSHHIGIYHTGLTAVGVAGFYLTIASTLNGIADLRVGSAYTYFIARGRKAEELTGTYFALRLGMVAAVSGGLFLLAPYFYFVQGATTCLAGVCSVTIPASTEVAIFGLFLVTPLLWSPGTVYSQLWIARGDSIRSQYPLLLQSIVQASGLIIVALLSPGPVESLWGFALAYALGGVASAIFTAPAVIRLWHRVRWAEMRRMFLYAWPLMGGLALAYVWTNAPTFFVATLSSSAVAIFLAANGFRILLLGLPNAVSVPLFPHLTNLHVRREYELLRRRTWAALRYTAMLVVPAAIAMVVYRAPLLNTLFVGTYASGALPLALLAASAIPAAFSQIILTALTSVGRQRLDLYLMGLQVVVLLGVAFLLLPPFHPLGNLGLMGAAIAVLSSSLAGLALNTYFLERTLAIRIQPRVIGAILLSAVASFLAVSRLNSVINPNRWYLLLAAVLLGFVVYFLVLSFGTGELSKRDVRALVSYLGLPTALGNFLARFCRRMETRDAGEILLGGRDTESDHELDRTRLNDPGDSRRRPPPGAEEAPLPSEAK
ncbi:MAG: polysaccharide biosynthesis C-terminal domain-containing protein [Thermoplasmata archaeon]